MRARVHACTRVHSPLLRVSRSLPAAASPSSEFIEEGIETSVALLQKGISIQLFLGYKHHLTCLLGKAGSAACARDYERAF